MSDWLQHLVFVILFFVLTASALPSDYVRYLIESARENNDIFNDDGRFLRVNRNQGGSASLDSLALPMFRYG